MTNEKESSVEKPSPAAEIRGAYGYRLTEVGRPLERHDLPPLEPEENEVVVRVAGCGVCHTDVSFAIDGVPTRHPLPLILGHEIAGRVVAAGESAAAWLGRSVIVPAVIPCGSCPACRAGRPTICRQQFMPGNHGDGGFATHVRVPANGLCEVPEKLPPGISLPMLSTVADAVTTPLEAIRRAELGAEDVAVFVGVGGVGGFGVQIAAALGAGVVALDIDQERLDLAARHGAELVLDPSGMSAKDLKSAVSAFAKESGRSGIGRKIFETSGNQAGQLAAFNLLDPGGYLAVVGFTPDKVEIRLSNLMAFDATARGNWGSSPERYPEALSMVLEGAIQLAPYVEMHSLDEAPALIEAAARHELRRRPILMPASGHDSSLEVT